MTDQPQWLVWPDNPRAGNLAVMRGQAGDAAGAAQAFADLLADRIRVLGEDHPPNPHYPEQPRRRAGGGGGCGRGRAGPHWPLESMVQVLGEDHPHLLVIRRNLDHWRKEAERTPESANDHS
ncbi:tetratricopeptide repeat protein [Streptomyces sp. NBC_00161]|uniref:tetratricopeptide repeat protein n=1 Tax=Streptomyces sp. NBC_00161 TaxID=2975671 RepID=UPI00386D721B